MLSLISLLLISGLFIACLLIISNNYEIITNNLKTNRFAQTLLLEESSYIIPYVIQKYYSYIIDIRSKIVPYIFTTSFWYENSELIRNKESKYQNLLRNNILKRISLILALILYYLIVFFWLKYRRSTLSYQLLVNTGLKDETWNLDLILGIDGLSIPFIALIGFILPLVYLSNWTTINHLPTQYYMIIILLEIFLIIVFLVIDLIMFYVFFESILPPLFVLIGLYGASQKFRAGYYLFLYTLFGSLFMLLIFVKMGGDTATNFFIGYTNHNGFTDWQVFIWIILFVSFSVKTPLLPVHIWLPLAHSDANVSGSIILASIVLKLALYGFLRILIGIFFIGTTWLTPFILGLCSISVVYSSFTTIRQFDLKVLVAYSSIAHMASSLLGTFSDTLYGLIGSIIFGLAHGFVSPGLFLIVGAVLYDRCGSRIINYYRGLNAILPFLALIFLILVFGNMGVPLTGNFIGEFLSLLGAYQQNIFIASIGALSVILSAVYSIFMYNRVTSGTISPYIHTIPDIFRKEYYILIPLILLTIILGIYPSFISADIEFGLSNLLLVTIFPFFSNSKCNPNTNSILNLKGINNTNKYYKRKSEFIFSLLKYKNNKISDVNKLLLYIRKKFFIFVIFIFLPWLITKYPNLLGIDLEFGLSQTLLTGNLWGTMAALIFEKAEIKSETLHNKVNNPHTTPVVSKVTPSIGDNNDRKDKNITNIIKSEDSKISDNVEGNTKTENLKNIEKDKDLENTMGNENQKNSEKIENTENSLKKENIENLENKENSDINKSDMKRGVNGDDSNELDIGIRNMSLNDQSQSTSVSLPSPSPEVKEDTSVSLPSTEEDTSEGLPSPSAEVEEDTSVGLPSSEEGTSRFVGLNDEENKPVNPAELRARMEKLPRIIEEEKNSYIQDRTIEKYSSMTPEEYKVYCENNSTKPSTNPNIPQDKIINVVKWPIRKDEDSDDESLRGSYSQGSENRTTTSSESSNTTRNIDSSFVDLNGKPIHGFDGNNLNYNIYDLLKMNFSIEDIILFINQINLSTYNISILKIIIVFIPFAYYIMKFYTLYLHIKSNQHYIDIIFLKTKDIIKKYFF